MPTYEYICAKCEHKFETVQSITAKALTICPRDLCPKKVWGKGKVKRVIGLGGGLIFKGSGFYTTDYRSEKYKAAAKNDASGGTASSTEGAKKETKSPAAGGSSSTPTPAPASPAPAQPKKD